ncbi:MAG: tetratricopeptide repeat protein [Myxococcota bacterium]|nr:tetratricopeptide repeat protein [Myxococcota bacterium]
MPIGRAKSTAIRWTIRCVVGLIFAAMAVHAETSDPGQAGLAALDAGEFEQALPLLEKAVAREPGDAFLHYALGITAVQQGKNVLAAAALQRAVELEPDLPGAQAELGLTLARLGEREAALDHLLEALLQGPDDPDVLLQLGILDADEGEFDRALRYFAEAADIDPEIAGAAWYESAGVALDQGDLEAATRYLEQAAASTGSETAAKEAREMLAALSPAPPRRLVIWGGFGFEYDDNLTLSDVDLTTGIGDTATLFDASLDAFLVRQPDLQISVGYDFYQSLYTTLSEFDLQSNSPHVEIAAGSGRLIGSAAYRFTYDTLGGNAFLATHRGDFALEYAFIPYIVGSLGARVEGQTFEQLPSRNAQRITLEMGVRLIDPDRPVTFEIGWRPIWNDA